MERVDPLLSTHGRNWLLNCLWETPPEDIGKSGKIQLLNLLCSDHLPGNENVDIRGCLAQIDKLVAFIKGSIERTFRAYGVSADYSYCKFQTWMSILVTRMKREFGVCYSPPAKADLDAGIKAPFSDASEVFVNGMLRDDRNRRWGTCSSIPVLVTAIARDLGYPVQLAAAKNHLYCRWEGNGRCFNVEASNAMGMAVEPDEHFRTFRGGLAPKYEKSGYYFRSLTAAEEFACFMADRVYCLADARRYAETFIWSARALQFSPNDPGFPRDAYGIAECALKNRLQSDKSLVLEERAPVMTITGHYRELMGELDAAREAYVNACRHNFDGNNEQRDLQRFLTKYDLPPTRGPLLPGKNLGIPRRFVMKCSPEREADELRSMADYFEKRDEPLKARDALHDLYMFDPCNAEVFQRCRALEKLPLFQAQSKALIERKRQEIESQGLLPKAKTKPSAPVRRELPKGPLNVQYTRMN